MTLLDIQGQTNTTVRVGTLGDASGGVDGVDVMTLPIGNFTNGVFAVPRGVMASILAGQAVLNVATTQNPTGADVSSCTTRMFHISASMS
jgi:hypothetical protein